MKPKSLSDDSDTNVSVCGSKNSICDNELSMAYSLTTSQEYVFYILSERLLATVNTFLLFGLHAKGLPTLRVFI